MPNLGPELPPHLAKRKRSPDDDNDDTTSSPPSKIQAASIPKERRLLGPAALPAPLDQRSSFPAQNSEQIPDDGSSSSSDDEFGPSLPPTAGSAAAAEA